MPLSTLTWKKRLAKMLRRFNLRQLQTMMRVMRWVQWSCNCSNINPCTSGTLKFHWFCCLLGTVCKGSMYQMCNWSRKIRMKPVFCRPVNGRFQTMKREWVSLMTDQCPDFKGQAKITWDLTNIMMRTFSAKLDGTTEKVKSRLAQHTSIEVVNPKQFIRV